MSNARQLADLAATGHRRNLLLNPDIETFGVYQRGTTSTGVNGKIADRWNFYGGVTHSATQQKAADGLKATVSAANEQINFSQVIEGAGIFLAGKVVTLSIEATSSITAVLEVGHTIAGVGNFTVPVTWQAGVRERKSLTFTWPSGYTADQVGIVMYRIATAGGESFTLHNAQLELGSIATPLEYRPYGEELELCKRYYQASATAEFYILPTNSGSQIQRHKVHYRPHMRTTPTVATYHYSGGAAVVAVDINSAEGTLYSITGAVDNYVAYNWTADADL